MVGPLSALCFATGTHAQRGDGAYGRFDHALVFSFDAGASLALPDSPRFSAAIRGRVLDVAGPVLSMSILGDAPTSVHLGVEIRPLFPALFLLDMSTGNEWLDLFVGSIGVEVGVAFVPDHGIGLSYAFGLELPLLFSKEGHFDGLRARLEARRIKLREGAPGTPEGYESWELFVGLDLRIGVAAHTLHQDPVRSTER